MLNGSIEKLKETAERTVKEWKESRREKKRLLEEIAEREAAKPEACARAFPINGVKYMTQHFEQVDVDRMIKTANELVRRDPKVVAVFYGVDKKTARIVVMAEGGAVNLGVDLSEIAGESASVRGGGGSSRRDFAQGGGTLVKKMSDALAKAEEITRKQVKKARN